MASRKPKPTPDETESERELETETTPNAPREPARSEDESWL